MIFRQSSLQTFSRRFERFRRCIHFWICEYWVCFRHKLLRAQGFEPCKAWLLLHQWTALRESTGFLVSQARSHFCIWLKHCLFLSVSKGDSLSQLHVPQDFHEFGSQKCGGASGNQYIQERSGQSIFQRATMLHNIA